MRDLRTVHVRFLEVLVMLLTIVVAGEASADLTVTHRSKLETVSGAWGCGDSLKSLWTGTWSAPYTSTLPAGAKITNVKIEFLLQQSSGNSTLPAVSMTLNGQSIGSAAGVYNYTQCPLRSNLLKYTFEQSFTQPFAPYTLQGTNNVGIGVTASCYPGYGSNCGITFANPSFDTFYDGPNVTLTYNTGVEAYVQSGDGQRAAVTGPTELPLVVRLASADPNTTIPGKTVDFKITSQPNRATGAAIGLDENATGITYAVQADAQGLARATLILGDKPGTYTVEASSPLSNTNVPAKFTVTAATPASFRIARFDPATEDETYLASGVKHVILPHQGGVFRSVGLDSAGARLGRVRSDWKIVTKGISNPGGATANPNISATTTILTPTAFGDISLEATTNPRVVSGTAKALANISTGVFLDVDNNFQPTLPIDDLPKFIPGSTLNGASVSPNTSPLQRVTLHVLTPPNATGSISFELTDVSTFPGLAMNYPITGGAGDDMYFRDGTGASTSKLSAVPFDASGDTLVTLYVNDYGARARLNVTVAPTGKAPLSVGPLGIPLDNDGNGLPDAGWHATGVAIGATGLTAADDLDPNAQIRSVGDGFSAYEEYRGFIATTSHVRLDPRAMELFVDADQQLLLNWNGINAIGKLPVRVIYLNPGETAGIDHANRVERSEPVVNPNRADSAVSPLSIVPGAKPDGQRAVRLVYQDRFPPVYEDRTTNVDYAVWRVDLAAVTLTDWFTNIYVLNDSANVPMNEAPNMTQFIEVYPQAFTNMGFVTGFNRSYTDAAGSVVPDCATVPNPQTTVCDDRLAIPGTPGVDDGFVRPHARDIPGIVDAKVRDLYSVIDPAYSNEYYSMLVHQCGGGQLHALGAAVVDLAKSSTITHELGHAVALPHNPVCENIMYDQKLDIFPVKTDFDQQNFDLVDLFR